MPCEPPRPAGCLNADGACSTWPGCGSPVSAAGPHRPAPTIQPARGPPACRPGARRVGRLQRRRPGPVECCSPTPRRAAWATRRPPARRHRGVAPRSGTAAPALAPARAHPPARSPASRTGCRRARPPQRGPLRPDRDHADRSHLCPRSRRCSVTPAPPGRRRSRFPAAAAPQVSPSYRRSCAGQRRPQGAVVPGCRRRTRPGRRGRPRDPGDPGGPHRRLGGQGARLRPEVPAELAATAAVGCERIAEAARRGEPLPPIDVYQIGDMYFVRDGTTACGVPRARPARRSRPTYGWCSTLVEPDDVRRAPTCPTGTAQAVPAAGAAGRGRAPRARSPTRSSTRGSPRWSRPGPPG